MYKYIVYCSVSAAIIIASKYLYQHWIKQNHIISTLKQELAHLNDKVKRLESEMEKRAHVFSGGVQIPINFVKATTTTTTTKTEGGSPKTIILLNEDISSASASGGGSSTSSSAPSLPPRSSSSVPPPPRSSPSPSPRSSPSPSPRSPPPSPPKILDICDKVEDEEEKEDKRKVDEEDTTVHSLISNATTNGGKERRKKKLPDAKQYTNGSKIKDEEDQCEYLCVVGKRGGHSWKKI